MNEEKMIKTPHIEAKKSDVAKIIIMPGDPLRAEHVAYKYLKNVRKFNGIRGMFGYTGELNGKEISIHPSGMGPGSCGIYYFEFFKFFNVETIIRMGTCGAYRDDLNANDIIVAKASYSGEKWEKWFVNEDINIINIEPDMLKIVKDCALKHNIEIKERNVHSTSIFYTQIKEVWKKIETSEKFKPDVVEMESFTLHSIARLLNKKALTLLAVSDSLVKDSYLTPLQRQEGMINLFNLVFYVADKLNN